LRLQSRPAAGFRWFYTKGIIMFFLPLLAVPLWETIGTVVLATVTARLANDAYDKAKEKVESDE